ncbi:MAG: ABC transporter permease, partial [Methylobacterium sp.]|nr:ABC transporter permease [Methylobacterium sp.]
MASKQALSLAGTVGRELSTVAITLLGLLAVTFFIARVMPVDPV